MSEITRRTFVNAGVGLAAGMFSSSANARGDVNNRLRAAVLGVHSRGWEAHVPAIYAIDNCEVAVLCDPDAKVLAKRAAEFEKKFGKKVETAQDFRAILDRKDIDIVTVATPNHWHALATILACQAGKDVYVEKPGSHNLFEGRKMIEAARKFGRIVQHGVQLRSSTAIREAVDLLREGIIGDVYMARGLVFRSRRSIGKRPDKSPPAHLDWNLWQGPAQERPFSERYVHYDWHWSWDYGNGDIGNQGVHETDMCLWGLDVGLPSEISAMGGKFLWDDDKETPEVLSATFLYPAEKKIIEFEVRPWNTNTEQGVGVGNIFYGSKGFMTIDGYNKFAVYLGDKREPGPSGKGPDPLVPHFKNFVEAVRSRNVELQHGPVESAHTSSGLAHLANIAYRLGRRLHFDPKTETFPSDKEANALLTREYRKPFVVGDV